VGSNLPMAPQPLVAKQSQEWDPWLPFAASFSNPFPTKDFSQWGRCGVEELLSPPWGCWDKSCLILGILYTVEDPGAV
jgi:hypothetical protein